MTSSRSSRGDAGAGVTALILAGGRATRLGGVDKREVVIEGRTIFARQCEVLRPRVDEIVVSSPREVPGFRTVADAVPGAGPLAGIAAGLAAATTPWLLVVAGDMPYVTGALVDLVLGPVLGPALGPARGPARAHPGGVVGATSSGAAHPGAAAAPDAAAAIDAVGIRIGALPEPLLCALRVAAARPVVAARLAAGRLKASRLLTDGELRVAWIEEAAVRAIDPDLQALFNVNAPEDVRR